MNQGSVAKAQVSRCDGRTANTDNRDNREWRVSQGKRQMANGEWRMGDDE